MTVFIAPIVIVLLPLFQSVGQTDSPVSGQLSFLWIGLTFLLPSSMIAMSLGNFMIGEEGQAVWRIYASPFSAKSLVKSKYSFIIMFALLVLAITGTTGALVYRMSSRAIIVALIEAVSLIFALGAVSLANGIKGADFNEVPRSRMIRVEWGLINFFTCAIVGLLVISPLLTYLFSRLIPGFGLSDPYLAAAISVAISTVATLIAYRLCIKNAEELLLKAEV
jgi:hypothetical protein